MLIASATLVCLPGQAVASHKSSQWGSLQQKIRDTKARIREAEAKERGLMGQIAASDSRRQRLESTLAALGGQIAVATDNLTRLQAQATQAQIQLDIATRDLEWTLSRLDHNTEVLSTRASETYMRGPAPFLDVLLGAEDFESFVVTDAYISSVLSSDAAALTAIKEARVQVEAKRAAIASRKTVVDHQVTAINATRNRLATIRMQREHARKAAVREIEYRRVLLKKVRSEKEAYLLALASLQSNSNSMSAMLRSLQRGQKVYAGSGHGYLRVPVSGRISSPYGWRTHPIYKNRSFHTGIDIAAPAGRGIAAARSGKVVYVGYKGAYGLVAIVDHGYSVATVYAHMSKVYVQTGQRVGTGKTIGAIGCTGWCTGPHIHFEVRVRGEHRNPRGWF
jgi:murein DD-endopeptidase MepM/ murein hydrolase activator NlpD